MADKVMLDTNLWVYFYAKNPQDKCLKVIKIINDNFELLTVSTQILGELYNVLTKKNLTTKAEAKQIIGEVATNFTVVEIDILKVLAALDINIGYGYSYWDSLVISTALLNDCNILYSEDMQHNQLIENKTRIVNPF